MRDYSRLYLNADIFKEHLSRLAADMKLNVYFSKVDWKSPTPYLDAVFTKRIPGEATKMRECRFGLIGDVNVNLTIPNLRRDLEDVFYSDRRVTVLDTDVASMYPKTTGSMAMEGLMARLDMVSDIKRDAALKRLTAIEKVIFNDPATIVFWKDGTKTVVKAENEIFDKEKGLAMAIAKKVYGNKGSYFNEFKKWISEEEEPNYYIATDARGKVIGKIVADPETFESCIRSAMDKIEANKPKPKKKK